MPGPAAPRGLARAVGGVTLALALAVSAPEATAAPLADSGPTFLAWQACSGDPLASGSAYFSCASNSGAVYTLVGSFSLAVAVAHAASMSADLEITFPTLSDVPPFWNTQLGGCNESALSLAKTLATGCAGHGNAFCSGDSTLCDIVFATTITPGSNVLKLNITLTRAPFGSASLAADPQRYYAFAVNMPMLDAGRCNGCASGAVASWTRGTIYPVDDLGRPLPPVTVSSSYPGALGCAQLNGGTSEGCATTPVLLTTWGRLKSLYR